MWTVGPLVEGDDRPQNLKNTQPVVGRPGKDGADGSTDRLRLRACGPDVEASQSQGSYYRPQILGLCLEGQPQEGPSLNRNGHMALRVGPHSPGLA